MSSQEQLNITRSSVSGNCDLKCAFNFNYQTTSLVATNNGMQISLQVDEQNTPPVTYNTEQYKVISFSICSPSSLIYDGNQAPAEIAIEHIPVNGGEQLIVFIPMYASGNSNSATDLITEIISNVSSSAPSSGEQTTINLNNFSLQNIVPSKPFYTFSIGNVINVIAYGINTGIPLNQSTLTTLSGIIGATPAASLIGLELFFNAAGPNSSGSDIGDGIYISCNPTGSSETTTPVVNTKNDISNIINNPMVKQVFVGCLLFIIIFFLISMLFDFISGKKTHIMNSLTAKKPTTTTTT